MKNHDFEIGNESLILAPSRPRGKLQSPIICDKKYFIYYELFFTDFAEYSCYRKKHEGKFSNLWDSNGCYNGNF